MEFSTIIFTVKDNGVASITLNRPELFNSFNDAQIGDVLAACRLAAEDDAVKVLVITGAGKSFSAGGDAGMLAAMQSSFDARYIFDRSALLIQTIYSFPKPVIAAVNGVAAGAATGAALACDIVIASEKAKFAANFVNIAFVPDGGTSYFLFEKLGHHRAAEILFTGKILDAQEGLQAGVFNRVVPPESLEEEVYKLAGKIAAGPPITLKYMKNILRACSDNTLQTIASLESGAQVMCWNSQDFREGIQAFLEKRKPVFQGK
ncbi:enoyl-CoA hydratase/isomerase family protein [Syntrophomonas curvata]